MGLPFRVLGGPRIQSFIDGPWIRLREMSNFCCLPGRAGELPLWFSPYGLQKYIGELYGRLFLDVYGLQTVSLRYFNVYGPGASAEGAYALVIAKFTKQRFEGVGGFENP
jgi:nucleoside-diphosphate-sugar epimerase